MPDANDAEVPSTADLQFDRAETAPEKARMCVACKLAPGPAYYEVQGQTVCGRCARGIEARWRPAAASTLPTAAIYGLGAAAAGCAIYARVAIVFHLQLELIAILVGYMVARAVRYGSGGLGGRPQQILAAALTYFAVSASYLVIVAYSSGRFLQVIPLLMFLAAGPFLMVAKNSSAVLSLVIIGFGVWRAWKMTAQPKVSIAGPFQEGG